MSLLNRGDVQQLAFGLDHPEGVTTGPDGKLYAGGMAGQLYRLNDRRFEVIARTGGICLGLCLDCAGAIYVCDARRRAVLRVTTDGEEPEVWCDRAGDRELVLPNDCAFAPDGALWFTDSGVEDPDRATGRLIRVPPGGGRAEVQPLEPLHFANGLCVGDDGIVYVLESFGRRLSAYDNGRLTTIAEMPHHNPDGVALDRDGGFVIASYYPFALLSVKPTGGSPEVVFQDEWGVTLRMPANASFYGAGLEQLAISNLGGWTISSITAPVRGAPLHYPRS